MILAFLMFAALQEITSLGFTETSQTGPQTIVVDDVAAVSVSKDSNDPVFQIDTHNKMALLSNTMSIPNSVSFGGNGIHLYTTSSVFQNPLSFSNDGRYQVWLEVGSSISIKISSDFGLTLTSPPNANLFRNGVVSNSGKHMFLQGGIDSHGIYNKDVSISHDYGVNWKRVSYDFGRINPTSCVISDDGLTIITACGIFTSQSIDYVGTELIVSYDGGNTWAVSADSIILTSNASSVNSPLIAISNDGEYQFYVDAAAILYISNNYGKLFFNSFKTTKKVNAVCCSIDGQYVFIAVYDQVNNYLYRSSDYGVTFVNLGQALRVDGVNALACSNSGQFIVVSPFGGGLGYSTDYGISWTEAINSGNFVRVSGYGNFAVFLDGAFNVYSFSTSQLFSSGLLPSLNNQYNIGSPTLNFANGYFSDAVYVAGIQLISDERFKEDIQSLPIESRDFLKHIQPITYRFTGQTDRRFGFSAQQIEKTAAFENALVVESNGRKTVNLIELLPFLVEKINRLEDEIEILKHR